MTKMPSSRGDSPATLTRDSFASSPIPIERELRRLFPSLDAHVVFDIGSCEGEDAIRYAALFPSATVYAFEPVPENVQILRNNLTRRGNPNVRVLEVALSDQLGRAPFHVSSGSPLSVEPSDWDYGNKSSSLLQPDQHLSVHPWVHFDRQIDVEMDTIERLCRDENIEQIDFVHLDVQGAELKVLAGAGPYLQRIGAIWMEVEAIPLYRDQPLKADVEQFMARHGFRQMLSTVNTVSGDQLYFNPTVVRPSSDLFRLVSLAVAPTSVRPDRAVRTLREVVRRTPGLRRTVEHIRAVAHRVIMDPIRERRAISHWRRAGSPAPPPSAFKHRVVRAYGRAFGLHTLVETGTYLGDMVEAQRGRFGQVWSIELSHELHLAAQQRFAHAENVDLLEGDSGELMRSVLARLDGAAVFWLDGHYSEGVTARGSLETPIRRELEAILSSSHDHCVLVDDARLFGTGDYPSVQEICNIVRAARPNWSCIARDDIIRIHPRRRSTPL